MVRVSQRISVLLAQYKVDEAAEVLGSQVSVRERWFGIRTTFVDETLEEDFCSWPVTHPFHSGGLVLVI